MQRFIVEERIARDLIPGDDILIGNLEGLVLIEGIREVEPISDGKFLMLTMDNGRIRTMNPEARVVVLERNSL